MHAAKQIKASFCKLNGTNVKHIFGPNDTDTATATAVATTTCTTTTSTTTKNVLTKVMHMLS